MYLPTYFQEQRSEHLNHLIRAYPFATLLTIIEGEADVQHLPFLYLEEQKKFTAHIPKVNPLYLAMRGQKEFSVKIVFHGPHAYITPKWYPSKFQTGKVVPTWNYAVVHVKGVCRFQEDVSWIKNQIDQLTNQHEKTRDSDWQLADAPADFTDAMLKVLVGLEIDITEMTGKFKVSQNRSESDRLGVESGLSKIGLEQDQHIMRLSQKINKK